MAAATTCCRSKTTSRRCTKTPPREGTFAEAADDRQRSVDELARPTVESHEDVDKGHGRIERRVVEVTSDLSWLTEADRWPGLGVLVKITRERTVISEGSCHHRTEVAYSVGSDATLGAEAAGTAVRGHWTVETGLHWVLDVAFREDDARHRAGNTAQNLAVLRQSALNIIKQDKKRKLGVKNSRKRAGWDRSYLLELLTSAA